MIPSTKGQRQLIGIACNQMGIDKVAKADMLMERYGKISTRDISKGEANNFLKELKSKGFRPLRRRSPRPPIPRGSKKIHGIVTQPEMDKITAVAKLIRWRVENGQERWIKKRFGLDKVRTSHDAYLVIEGLKKMFENGMKKKYGERWWVSIYNDPGIETYIMEHCPTQFCGQMLLARSKPALKIVK